MILVRDVRHQTIVEVLQSSITWIELIVGNICDTAIRPPADSFVGRYLVEVEQVA